jgi:hypothetical protein
MSVRQQGDELLRLQIAGSFHIDPNITLVPQSRVQLFARGQGITSINQPTNQPTVSVFHFRFLAHWLVQKSDVSPFLTGNIRSVWIQGVRTITFISCIHI